MSKARIKETVPLDASETPSATVQLGVIDVDVVKPAVVGASQLIMGAARSIVTTPALESAVVPRFPAPSATEFAFNLRARTPSEHPVTETVITVPVSALGVKTQPTALAEVVLALMKSLDVRPVMLSLNVNV